MENERQYLFEYVSQNRKIELKCKKIRIISKSPNDEFKNMQNKIIALFTKRIQIVRGIEE